MSDDDEDTIIVLSSDEDEIDQKPDIKKIRLLKQSADCKNFLMGGREIVLKTSRKQASLKDQNPIAGLIPNSKDESFFENNSDYRIENCNESKIDVWISDFSIFDKKNRMRFLDSMEETEQFMLNGFVTPIAIDGPIKKTAIKVGPIDKLWWINGYMPGESIVITVTTDIVNYNLKLPAEQYQAYHNEVLEKAYYVKFIVELLKYGENDDMEATLEDLKKRIKRSDKNFPRNYCKPSLARLKSASKFIMKQIENLDDNSDDDEASMLESNLIKRLERWIEEEEICKKRPIKLTPPQQTTPVVYGNFSACFSQVELSCCLTKSDKNKVVTLDEDYNNIEIVDEVLNGKIMEHEEVKPPRWVDEPIHSTPSCKTYNSVFYRNKKFLVNDYAIMNPRVDGEHFSIGKITKLFSKNGEDMMHVLFFNWARDLVKRKQHYDNKELFLGEYCADVQIKTLRDKTEVVFKSFDSNWKKTGGLELIDTPESFFCHKWYDEKQSRFTDLPIGKKSNCLSCDYKSAEEKFETPKFCKSTNSMMWQGNKYMIGSDVFVNQLRILSPKKRLEIPCTNKKQFPESSRKILTTKMMSSPSLFKIGRIEKFYQPKFDSGDDENIEIKLQLYHRSENKTEDLNYLYYTMKVEKVKFKDIAGKCCVIYGKPKYTDELYHDLFYFLKGYSIYENRFYNLPPEFTHRSENQTFKCNLKLKNKLKALDLFCGCGGLSEGFKMAGLVQIQYAVDINSNAAKAFKLNNPGAIVFNMDCSIFVKILQEGKSSYKGKPCPKRGDVDIIMAGPPCQGFSGLNRHRNSQKSRTKNASIATFLSVVDILRPEFFILENINFSGSHQDILKTILGTGLEIGYQLAFGLLTSGNYGVPQNRIRLFVFGAAPGKKLPLFPEPIFAFKSANPCPTIKINKRICTTNIKRKASVPFRCITVGDATTDLPIIANGGWSTCYGQPKTQFQRLMRKRCVDGELKYHFCKKLDDLDLKRTELIPKGGDWTHLPNKKIKLRNGDKTDKINYDHSHHEGIICQERKCMPKQMNTIIPYTLVRTADSNGKWPSAFGRLDEKLHFDTVTTIQSLARKERIIHPTQDRVLSIQEYARAQGFGDHFQFCGKPAVQLKQIGNAVPVLLAKAIADEFKKCIVKN